VVPYPDLVPFADNRFDCCDLLQRSVIHHGTDKASGISSTNQLQTIGLKKHTMFSVLSDRFERTRRT
jgi:hypothetical protein